METEVRHFESRDDSGNAVVIIAERDVVPIPQMMGCRRGPWRYRTEDGRAVRPGPAFGHYYIDAINEHLMATDQREPQADDCF